MKPENKLFLTQAHDAAKLSGHIFPEMAACEAALESHFGESILALQDKNLFGMKQHQHPVFGTHVLPTKEFLDGKWVELNSSWISYPDWESCFLDRMATLKRLGSFYPHYAAALKAANGAEFVTEVSRTWSTDPQRSEKVLAIYNEMAGDWSATQNA